MENETYLGPLTLQDALVLSDYMGGIISGMAESIPDGDFVAMAIDGGERPDHVIIRRKHKRSGHAASVANTGAWLTEEEVSPNLTWRPI